MFAVNPRYIPVDDAYVLNFANDVLNAKYIGALEEENLRRRLPIEPGCELRCSESEIHNTDKEFRIRLELDHYKPEEVKITSDDKHLTIHAKHEEKQDRYGCVAREYLRTYKLPPNVDTKSATSTLNANGVLSIKIAKKPMDKLTEMTIPITLIDDNPLLQSIDLSDSMDATKDILELNISEDKYWKSYDEDEDESEEEEEDETELANNPAKKILWAAENNKLDIVKELLSSDPSLVKSCDADLYTPLHRASYNNHRDMAELLISHGADVAARTADGWQPLHSAARWNAVDTAKLLIEAGADVNALTNGHLTPLHISASEPDNREMLELLLTTPFINGTIRSKAGETAREICYRCSPNYKLFDLLDESKVSPDAK